MRTARKRAAAQEAEVGDHLPYAAQIDDFTILTRDGSAMQIIRLAGLPFETIDVVQLEARKTARDAMVQAIASSQFALVHHVVRRAVTATLEGNFGDRFSAALDTAWRTRLANRRLYVNDLYLTLIIRPLAGRAGLAERLLNMVGAGSLPAANVVMTL
jgi:type IV secretion system protein VirB4